MEAVRQKFLTPKNHEITIHVPASIRENEEVEVLVMVNKPSENYQQKIALMNEAKNDKEFHSEIKNIMNDYKNVDAEWWE